MRIRIFLCGSGVSFDADVDPVADPGYQNDAVPSGSGSGWKGAQTTSVWLCFVAVDGSGILGGGRAYVEVGVRCIYVAVERV
jgi:hypothetical protein